MSGSDPPPPLCIGCDENVGVTGYYKCIAPGMHLDGDDAHNCHGCGLAVCVACVHKSPLYNPVTGTAPRMGKVSFVACCACT